MNKLYFLLTALFLLFFLLRLSQTEGLSQENSLNDLEISDSLFYSLRYNLSERIKDYLPEPQASLLSGILLGERSSLPAEFNNNLKKTSTIHIVVVSGQNLTMLMGFIISLGSLLGRKKTVLLSLPVMIFYCILTGLQVPVIRAALMVGLASLASLLGREKDTGWVLGITVALMLIFNPSWLFSISFQLSVLATIGVVIVAPVLIKALKFIPEIIKEDLGVTIAAQALTLPIIAYNFYQISLVGILVNSLILWVIPIIMVFGAIALVGSYISYYLGWLLFIIPNIFLTYFVYLVNFFANLPLASYNPGVTSVFFWLGYYLIILGAFIALKGKNLTIDKHLE